MRTLRLLLLSLLITTVFIGGAEAKDEWVQVRSKNFFLIGNASEKDIKRAGTRLEQFRQLFRQMKLTASIPTNVVVFNVRENSLSNVPDLEYI